MLEEILHERKKKLGTYEEKFSAFPAAAVLHEPIFAVREATSGIYSVVGRIFSIRDQGKIIFADVRDETGTLQLVADEDTTENFLLLRDTFDRGDIISAMGEVFITKRGEKSLKISQARIIAKAMRPLPDSWYGIEDVELRLRKRYLDFLMNEESALLLRKKATFWATIREFLMREKFLEVETPVLESIPGGAEAEPFRTHHNALGEDFFLRISLELPLKKLLVGGFERVFEIGRVFRNEGVDREHLQDYTTMECYAAYEDYEWMMEKMQSLYREITLAVCGTHISSYRGEIIDWGAKWLRIDYYEIFKNTTGIDLSHTSLDVLQKKAKELWLELEPFAQEGRLIDLIFKKVVRPTLIAPCFLINPPVAIEPLAKRMEKDSTRVYRFQIIAGGTELGKGFSELNDPRDQRERFEEQMRLREAGDHEAQMIDESFLDALEYGMPPAAGFGVSERLFAILMDKPIREIVAFPLLRKEK